MGKGTAGRALAHPAGAALVRVARLPPIHLPPVVLRPEILLVSPLDWVQRDNRIMSSSSDQEPPLSQQSRKPMSKDIVPDALHGLLPVVERWSAVASDEERYTVADFAEVHQERIEELERWVIAWTPEMHRAYANWEGKTPLTECFELCKFYFLLLMLDELEIRFPTLEVRPDPVAKLIAELKVFDGIAAVATRRFAARFLCDMEDDGKPAIAALQTATGDPNDGVRLWAHAALAVITRDPEPHRKAMRAIAAKSNLSESDMDPAFEAIDQTSEQRVIRRLMGATITNDLPEIRRLVGWANVDLPDHHGQRAAFYAVGNGHPEALQLLLEVGADANQRNADGETLLHGAARRRTGHLMIPLLLKYGADPTLKNGEGRTALEVAKECKRRRNIALLKDARP